MRLCTTMNLQKHNLSRRSVSGIYEQTQSTKLECLDCTSFSAHHTNILATSIFCQQLLLLPYSVRSQITVVLPTPGGSAPAAGDLIRRYCHVVLQNVQHILACLLADIRIVVAFATLLKPFGIVAQSALELCPKVCLNRAYIFTNLYGIRCPAFPNAP